MEPQNTTRVLDQHPQAAIKAACIAAAKEQFDVKWEPRAVRQHRSIKVGSLEAIDYAVPCFELANQLGVTPTEVAHRICQSLEAYMLGPILQDAKIESVSGYVNICLTDAAIGEAAKMSAVWFNALRAEVSDGSGEQVLILGPRLDYDENFAITDRSYYYIEQLYGLLGVKSTATYLVSDFSEHMVDYLTAAASGAEASREVSGVAYTTMNRATRQFLTTGDPNNDLHKVYETARNSWGIKRQEALRETGITNYKEVYEYEMRQKVSEYLDAGSPDAFLARGVIKDASSPAVYYEYGDDVIPIRSVNGLLYHLAYILYELDGIMEHVKPGMANRLIVLAPANMHYLIRSFAGLHGDSLSPSDNIVCFDPLTSRADILKISASITSPQAHLQAIATKLQNVSPYWFSNQHKRQALFALIDMPNELSAAITSTQLPSLFDLVSQSVETLSVLAE